MKDPILLNVTRVFSKKSQKKKTSSHFPTPKQKNPHFPFRQFTGPNNLQAQHLTHQIRHGLRVAIACSPQQHGAARLVAHVDPGANVQLGVDLMPTSRLRRQASEKSWATNGRCGHGEKKFRGDTKNHGGERFFFWMFAFFGMIIQPKHKKDGDFNIIFEI